ncbi:MAG: peroxiredoxin-like family protein [Sandaracinobacteroides sp.]
MKPEPSRPLTEGEKPMAESLRTALDRTFEDACRLEGTLGEQLRHVAEKVQALSPDYSKQVDEFIGRLEDAKAGASAPQIGERMPGFILPDDQGHLVSLDRMLEAAPVVIAFLRGHWCPYCRLNAHALAGIEDAIAPVRIVAISAETQVHTKALKSEAGAHFPFLTDIGNGYALSLNLAVWVDDAMSSLIAGLGLDIPEFQKQDGWIMPIPSVFVVAQDGVITARHVDPDYRRRLEIEDLRIVADAARATPIAFRAAD